jgi:hypothetical protein
MTILLQGANIARCLGRDFAPQQTPGAPHLARFSRDVGFRCFYPETLTLNPQFEVNIRQSHISRKTSEMWGTRVRSRAKPKILHPFSSEPTIPPTTPPSVLSLVAEGM